MVYQLLYEYKEVYSFKNRYFKYFNKYKMFLRLVEILIVCGGIYFCSQYYDVMVLRFVWSFPVLFIPIIFFIEIKRVTKEIHKVDSIKDYDKKCKALFLDRVKEDKIDIHNEKQMDMLFTIIDSEIKELKPSVFLNKAIVTGLFAPLWINYISSIYNNEVDNWREATAILFFFIIILTVIFFIGYQLKQTLYDEIIYSDYKKIKYMNNLLKDIYLTSLGTPHITLYS